MKYIAIIGAGLAGLTAANILKNHANITVFEKARGVSGRMTTRYANPYFFDHGAQYFTVKTQEFSDFIKPMIELDIIKPWNAKFAEMKNGEIVKQTTWNDEYKHFVGSPRMNAIAQHLAKDLNVCINTRVGAVAKLNDMWQLTDENDNHLGNFNWVIFAIPVDQLQELLPKNVEFYQNIQDTKMDACLSLMLGFDDSFDIPFDTAIIHDDIISWISVNSSKPNRNTPTCLLIHSTNDWANTHIDDNREVSKQQILDRANALLKLPKVDYSALHAWRYANIGKQDSPEFFIDTFQKISACGDWCIKGRVESAFTSAYELANQIKLQIQGA